jgi:hypothetical protein
MSAARNDATAAFMLLVPGALSAVGFLALASGNFFSIDGAAVFEFMAFLPWHLLCLTIAKLGLDTWILARASAWIGNSWPFSRILLTRTAPVCVCIAILMSTQFPISWAIAGAICNLLDSAALTLSNELAAHQKFGRSALAHMLKFPLFFVLIGIPVWATSDAGSVVVTALVLTSVCRLTYLLAIRPPTIARAADSPTVKLMVSQQVLNYGLFKNDQLTAAFIDSGTIVQRQVVYFSRIPELVSAFVVALAPILYSRLARVAGRDDHRNTQSSVGVQGLFALGAAALTVVFAFLGAFSLDATVTLVCLAVALHSILVLPVNARTNRLFAAQQERLMIRGLLISNMVGVVSIFAVFELVGPTALILWVAPLQLVTYLWITQAAHNSGLMSVP